MKLYGNHTQDAAERILEAFQRPEALPSKLAPIFLRVGNKPCHKWSWSNQLLCMLHDTNDARGFRQWQDVGRFVKKGAKAFWILVPLIKKCPDPETGEESTRVYGFKAAPVFRYEDTDGNPLPEDEDAERVLDALPLVAVARSWGLTVTAYNGANEPSVPGYYSKSGTIALGVENLDTWTHELVHAADDRLVGLKRGQHPHQEIVAELGGAILLKCLGLEHKADLGGSYDYVRRYAEAEGKEPVAACLEVLNRTCEAVRLLLKTADELACQAEAA